MYNLSRKREKKKFPTTGKDNIKKLKGNCVYRWYKTYNGTLHLTWKDESLTNRRDADSKFNFPIPLEMFCTQLPGAERRFADTRRHTPAWCDSCSLTAQGWKDLLHQALWSCDFITRRPSCSGLRERRRPQWKREERVHQHGLQNPAPALVCQSCSNRGGCFTTSWYTMSLTWYCRGNSPERFRQQHGVVLTCFCVKPSLWKLEKLPVICEGL